MKIDMGIGELGFGSGLNNFPGLVSDRRWFTEYFPKTNFKFQNACDFPFDLGKRINGVFLLPDHSFTKFLD